MLGCGAKVSTHPRVQTPDFRKLKSLTIFSKSELQRFFARYVSLCNENGVVELSDFVMQPELTFFPLASMLFQYEAKKLNLDPLQSVINFEGFIKMLHVVSPKYPLEEKYKCKFN
jgi:Ca2+-binding EF-hand superfamily protein